MRRSGADTFSFLAAGVENADRIADFWHGADTIQLRVIPGLLPAASLFAAAFKELGVVGARIDADDRVLYNSSTGVLSFDADGSETAFAAEIVATLLNKPANVDHTDFVIA